MVFFDIMLSHYTMMRWHESALDQHTHDLAQLHDMKLHMRTKVAQQLDIPGMPAPGSPATAGRAGSSDLIGAFHPNPAHPSQVAASGTQAAAKGSGTMSKPSNAGDLSGAEDSPEPALRIQITADASARVSLGVSMQDTPTAGKPNSDSWHGRPERNTVATEAITTAKCSQPAVCHIQLAREPQHERSLAANAASPLSHAPLPP